MTPRDHLQALYGALSLLIEQTFAAQLAFDGPAPLGNPEVCEELLKLRRDMTRGQGICLRYLRAEVSP